MIRVLVVDDEDNLRRMICRALRQDGFQVYEASSAADALRIATGRAGQIELLLTDVCMPGMNGLELADGLKRTYPGIQVLYMTGCADAAVEADAPLLRKPFHLETLHREIKRVLGAPQGAHFRECSGM